MELISRMMDGSISYESAASERLARMYTMRLAAENTQRLARVQHGSPECDHGGGARGGGGL